MHLPATLAQTGLDFARVRGEAVIQGCDEASDLTRVFFLRLQLLRLGPYATPQTGLSVLPGPGRAADLKGGFGGAVSDRPP